ncbi:MAG: hypothetical protein CBD10_003710 [Alphaproteobacteria bacterium TMED150]|nr:hypothetical protein [Paracoccaceae bacterium]RPH13865.1 MAG: hypothetical protein CBD10_003710 [Alphaproteobacteria bacterium TMED150]
MGNNFIKIFGVAAIFCCFLQPALASSSSPYSGMQAREIKSLSDDDINQLRRGGGWGLALPAELNGMPGPKHVLELKEELLLSTKQVEEVQTFFDEMKRLAIPVGKALINAEKDVEAVFRYGVVDETKLKALLKTAEQARTELRFIHLSQHYKTKDILSDEQVTKYNQLRGYAEDPCEKIPAGHNPMMYKKHMGCH